MRLYPTYCDVLPSIDARPHVFKGIKKALSIPFRIPVICPCSSIKLQAEAFNSFPDSRRQGSRRRSSRTRRGLSIPFRIPAKRLSISVRAIPMQKLSIPFRIPGASLRAPAPPQLLCTFNSFPDSSFKKRGRGQTSPKNTFQFLSGFQFMAGLYSELVNRIELSIPFRIPEL